MALAIAAAALTWPAVAAAADPAGCQGRSEAGRQTATAVAEVYKADTDVRVEAHVQRATGFERRERGHILWDAPLPQDPVDFDAGHDGIARMG
jgi:hypothetical protein